MKVFDLTCDAGHRFEGWFASADDFADQCGSRAVRCPLCDSEEIRREPSAPRLNLGTAAATPDTITASAASTVMQHLKRLIARTEDVGPRFAEEARRIHYDEAPARAIRGTATDREREDLHDEGIETLALPLPRALTETLQ